MAGTLYLCATPIGNLEDITFRVLRVLREADLIAAEDTRNSIRLLNYFEIETPMTSYHEYNKFDKGRVLIEKLLEGKDIALITDAGTPGISDPGEELVRMCYEDGLVRQRFCILSYILYFGQTTTKCSCPTNKNPPYFTR